MWYAEQVIKQINNGKIQRRRFIEFVSSHTITC